VKGAKNGKSKSGFVDSQRLTDAILQAYSEEEKLSSMVGRCRLRCRLNPD